MMKDEQHGVRVWNCCHALNYFDRHSTMNFAEKSHKFGGGRPYLGQEWAGDKLTPPMDGRRFNDLLPWKATRFEVTGGNCHGAKKDITRFEQKNTQKKTKQNPPK